MRPVRRRPRPPVGRPVCRWCASSGGGVPPVVAVCVGRSASLRRWCPPLVGGGGCGLPRPRPPVGAVALFSLCQRPRPRAAGWSASVCRAGLVEILAAVRRVSPASLCGFGWLCLALRPFWVVEISAGRPPSRCGLVVDYHGHGLGGCLWWLVCPRRFPTPAGQCWPFPLFGGKLGRTPAAAGVLRWLGC